MSFKLNSALAKKIVSYAVLPFFLASCSDSNKLDVYSCSFIGSALSCNNGCSIDKDFKFSFLVNKSHKTVFQIIYLDGKQDASITFENCNIFNDKNWDCSEFMTLQNVTIDRTAKMVNGIYAYHSENRNRFNGELRNKSEVATCAK